MTARLGTISGMLDYMGDACEVSKCLTKLPYVLTCLRTTSKS